MPRRPLPQRPPPRPPSLPPPKSREPSPSLRPPPIRPPRAPRPRVRHPSRARRPRRSAYPSLGRVSGRRSRSSRFLRFRRCPYYNLQGLCLDPRTYPARRSRITPRHAPHPGTLSRTARTSTYSPHRLLPYALTDETRTLSDARRAHRRLVSLYPHFYFCRYRWHIYLASRTPVHSHVTLSFGEKMDTRPACSNLGWCRPSRKSYALAQTEH